MIRLVLPLLLLLAAPVWAGGVTLDDPRTGARLGVAWRTESDCPGLWLSHFDGRGNGWSACAYLWRSIWAAQPYDLVLGCWDQSQPRGPHQLAFVFDLTGGVRVQCHDLDTGTTTILQLRGPKP
jgi:hypothetical protein